jgi:hypothetical protein
MSLRRALALAVTVLPGCAPPDVCGATVPATSSSLGRVVAHAHNDYEHERPLQDALDHHFASVEADVWHRDGDVVVSHDPWTSRGTLADLYLAPLAARVEARGTIHGDGAPFFLWLDLKDGTPELRALLSEALAAQPGLHRFTDDEGLDDVDVDRGPVVVVLTGDAGSKGAMLDEVPAPRPFVVDANAFPGPSAGGQGTRDAFEGDAAGAIDPRVAAFSLSSPTWLGAWDGVAPAPVDLVERARCVVGRAHSDGSRRRPVRFFGGPDTPAAWDLVVDVGVDFLHTDDLAGAAAFLAERETGR